MVRLKTLALVAGAATLVGCASAPEANDYVYESLAWDYVLGHKCNEEGYTDTQTSAAIIDNARWRLGQYRYDQARMDRTVREKASQQASPSVCKAAALRSETVSRQRKAQRQAYAASPAQNDRPTFTTCNKVFGQVNCVSY